MQVKGLISKNTIVLHPTEGAPINISKTTDELLFLEVEYILQNGTEEELLEKYNEIKNKIEKYTNKVFTVDVTKRQMYLKGDDVPMPELIVDKLLELEKAEEDFMPLIRFWQKLKTNPSKESVKQLYGFMVHNGIGLMEDGDIIVEKGVSKRQDGSLWDIHTKSIDNSIGRIVEMNRDEVDPDPNETCSRGLHVAPPHYVRRWYSGSTIVKCAVNPSDVVAVPIDYDNAKMRVCRYRVMGYSDLNSEHKPVYRLSDFVDLPQEQEVKDVKSPVTEEEDYTEQLVTMTGKEILDFIEEKTGVRMTYSHKSKRTLVKRGSELLEKHLKNGNDNV